MRPYPEFILWDVLRFSFLAFRPSRSLLERKKTLSHLCVLKAVKYVRNTKNAGKNIFLTANPGNPGDPVPKPGVPGSPETPLQPSSPGDPLPPSIPG